MCFDSIGAVCPITFFLSWKLRCFWWNFRSWPVSHKNWINIIFANSPAQWTTIQVEIAKKCEIAASELFWSKSTTKWWQNRWDNFCKRLEITKTKRSSGNLDVLVTINEKWTKWMGKTIARDLFTCHWAVGCTITLFPVAKVAVFCMNFWFVTPLPPKNWHILFANSSAQWAKYQRGNHQKRNNPAICPFSVKNHEKWKNGGERICESSVGVYNCLAGWLAGSFSSRIFFSNAILKAVTAYFSTSPHISAGVTAFNFLKKDCSNDPQNPEKNVSTVVQATMLIRNWKAMTCAYSAPSRIFQRFTTSSVGVIAIQFPDEITQK